jgi:DNA-binding NarL/FixJ family response regulator
MPGGGPELVHAVKSASPTTAVIAYTAHDDPITERQMRAAGVSSFLVKGDPQVDLAQAIADAAFLRKGGPS